MESLDKKEILESDLSSRSDKSYTEEPGEIEMVKELRRTNYIR